MEEFKTVGDMRRYFEDVERRLDDGQFIPTSVQGEEDRDRLLIAVTELARMIVEEHHKAKGGDQEALHLLIDLVDVRTRLAILLGKFEGFRHGQKYIVARAGSYSQYLV